MFCQPLLSECTGALWLAQSMLLDCKKCVEVRSPVAPVSFTRCEPCGRAQGMQSAWNVSFDVLGPLYLLLLMQQGQRRTVVVSPDSMLSCGSRHEELHTKTHVPQLLRSLGVWFLASWMAQNWVFVLKLVSTIAACHWPNIAMVPVSWTGPLCLPALLSLFPFLGKLLETCMRSPLHG